MPVVKLEDIGSCAGVRVSERAAADLGIPEIVQECDSPIPERIKGFDDKWRCPQCHRIHCELVFADTKPEITKRAYEKGHRESVRDETKFVLKNARRRDLERRQQRSRGLVDQFGRPVEPREDT